MTLHFWSSVFNFISKQCKSSIQRHFEHDKYAARITVLSNTLGNNSTSTAIHCLKKRCHFYFCNNFGKCTPILIILSLLNSQMYCGGSWDQNVHLKSIAALPCETWMRNCTTQCQRYILFYDDKLTNGWCLVDLFLYFFIISACWCHSDILLVVVVPFSYEDTSIDQCVCDSKHACVQEVETLNTCC